MHKHHKLDTVLRTIRQDLADVLKAQAIIEACRHSGHRWRDRVLTPVAVIHWFLRQILLGNTAVQHVSLLAERTFTDSAYCQARTRIPLEVFRILLRNLNSVLQPQTRTDGLWHGHRTFLIDGSAVSMPDTPELQLHFGQPGGQKAGCGFPVAKILAMFNFGTGLLMELAIAPLRTHEMSQIGLVHPTLQPGDVLVGDRGFCSFVHLAMLAQRGVHAVFRLHQRQIVDFAPGRPFAGPKESGPQAKGKVRSRQIRKLGPMDQVVEWFRPASVPKWLETEKLAAMPDCVTVRELQYAIEKRGYRTRQIVLVTTLLDAEAYPAESLAELYGMRWRVEQNLRDLKQTLGMDILKCKSVEGVLKEIHAFAIVHNLVRVVMAEAAKRQGVRPDRISFAEALRWLESADFDMELPRLVVNPERPGRAEPRVRKRRPKQFPLMKKPRAKWKQDLSTQQLAA